MVSTDTGHVLLDISALGVPEFAIALAERVKPFGVHLRPKAVRHLSLASRRHVHEQERIAELHTEVPFGPCVVDIVVSRLVQRSSIQRLQENGQVHGFCELLRIRFSSVDNDVEVETTRPCKTCELALSDVTTPVKKRRGDHLEREQAVPWRCDPDEATPPKTGLLQEDSAMDICKPRMFQMCTH